MIINMIMRKILTMMEMLTLFIKNYGEDDNDGDGDYAVEQEE